MSSLRDININFDAVLFVNNLKNEIRTSIMSALDSQGRKNELNTVYSKLESIKKKLRSELAIENNYQYVICGHIHQPQQRLVTTDKGSVTYLNSGDWIENLTSLEYYDNAWTLYHYDPKQFEEEKGIKKNKIINLREELSVMTKEVAFQVSM